MKISSSFNNKDKTQTYQSSFKGIPQKPIYLPNSIGKLGKLAGEYINTPEQKLLLATTALMFQPLIDLKYADEDKKIDSAIKSASKAIAGGITGVTIRALFQAITSHYIGNMTEKANTLSRLFYPRIPLGDVKRESTALAEVKLNQYCKTLGTFFAVLFMIFFSNSKMDVPLTNDLQDLIGGVVKEDKTWLKSLNDVSGERKNKIKKWFNAKYEHLKKIKNKLVKVANVLKEDTNTGTKKEPVNEITC